MLDNTGDKKQLIMVEILRRSKILSCEEGTSSRSRGQNWPIINIMSDKTSGFDKTLLLTVRGCAGANGCFNYTEAQLTLDLQLIIIKSYFIYHFSQFPLPVKYRPIVRDRCYCIIALGSNALDWRLALRLERIALFDV